jgi:hypothetical protein
VTAHRTQPPPLTAHGETRRPLQPVQQTRRPLQPATALMASNPSAAVPFFPTRITANNSDQPAEELMYCQPALTIEDMSIVEESEATLDNQSCSSSLSLLDLDLSMSPGQANKLIQ